jgi:hypothetical protein
MGFLDTATDLLNTLERTFRITMIGVPGRYTGGRLIAAFRSAGAVSSRSAQPFRAHSEAEASAFKQLLAAQVIRRTEGGRFYLDEEALEDVFDPPAQD